MNVYVDDRWPVGAGIRRMADLYRAAAPAQFELRDLEIATRIGSPLSPFAVDRAIRRARRRQPAGVFWNPGFIPPLPGTIRSIVTVHDLIHLHFYSRAHRLYYDLLLRPLYRACDLIVCISAFTRHEFLEWSGMPQERVVVVPNAIEPGFADAAPALQGVRPFVFYAGNRRSYKNVPATVTAFFAAGLARDGYDIVLTGEPDPALQEIARAGGFPDALRFTGFLDDVRLVAHYKAAACVAFLSKYEGFGLPILEAMACDTPLLLADATSLPEVAGDAALYVDPDDLEQIAAGMRTLCLGQDLRADLVARGRRRREAFAPATSSAVLWQHIAQVAGA